MKPTFQRNLVSGYNKELDIYQAEDLAISTKESADYTVM